MIHCQNQASKIKSFLLQGDALSVHLHSPLFERTWICAPNHWLNLYNSFSTQVHLYPTWNMSVAVCTPRPSSLLSLALAKFSYLIRVFGLPNLYMLHSLFLYVKPYPWFHITFPSQMLLLYLSSWNRAVWADTLSFRDGMEDFFTGKIFHSSPQQTPQMSEAECSCLSLLNTR